MTSFTDPTSPEKVNTAFRRYLSALERNEEIGRDIFEGLTQKERDELQGMIEVFDLVGVVGCSTTPSSGFLAGVRTRLREEQGALQDQQATTTNLFGAAVVPKAGNSGLGAWLKQRRLAADRRLQEVAQEAGCDAGLLADLEGGVAPPTSLAVEQWQLLAAAIRVGLADLLERIQAASSFSPAPTSGMARSVDEGRDFQDEYRDLIEQARRMGNEEEA